METCMPEGILLTRIFVQSNLWGMETTHCGALWLRPSWFNRIYEEWKLQRGLKNIVRLAKFNRIYEEWKPKTLCFCLRSSPAFNRIYEEWKPPSRGPPYVRPVLFNRIYEEWKQVSELILAEYNPRSIESMRNGNRYSKYVGLPFLSSSIESMRNGNWSIYRSRRREPPVQSNLWGMETGFARALKALVDTFNRIYEEWKPR